MTLRRDNKIILHLHTFLRRTISQPRTLALPKEQSRRIPHLHIRKMNTKTSKGTSSKSAESRFRSGRHGLFVFFEPAGDVKARKVGQGGKYGIMS